MLKKIAVALGLIIAAGAASTAANAGDYRHGYRSDYRYGHAYHRHHRIHPRRHYSRYGYHHRRAWRIERQNRRYARWWRKDY